MAVVGVVAGMVALPSTATPTHACTATIGLTGATGIGITNKLMAKVITHQSADW
jgi:hypothetical protein